MDSVDESHFVEIDEKANRNIHEFHVAEELRLVDRKDLLDGFGLNKNAVLNEHVESERFVTGKPLYWISTDFWLIQSSSLSSSSISKHHS